jgi:hypothetical protein
VQSVNNLFKTETGNTGHKKFISYSYKQVYRNHRMFTTTNNTDDKSTHTPTYTLSHMQFSKK